MILFISSSNETYSCRLWRVCRRIVPSTHLDTDRFASIGTTPSSRGVRRNEIISGNLNKKLLIFLSPRFILRRRCAGTVNHSARAFFFEWLSNIDARNVIQVSVVSASPSKGHDRMCVCVCVCVIVFVCERVYLVCV